MLDFITKLHSKARNFHHHRETWSAFERFLAFSISFFLLFRHIRYALCACLACHASRPWQPRPTVSTVVESMLQRKALLRVTTSDKTLALNKGLFMMYQYFQVPLLLFVTTFKASFPTLTRIIL